MKTIGQIVKRERTKRGWTQQDLADKIGIHSGYVCHIEVDRPIHISDALVSKLVRLFGDQTRVIFSMTPKNNAAAVRRLKRLQKKRHQS